MRARGRTCSLQIAATQLSRKVTLPHPLSALSTLRVGVATSDAAQRRGALARPADIYCVNYEQLPWLIEDCNLWPFRTIVADESAKPKGFRLCHGTQGAWALAKVSSAKGAKCSRGAAFRSNFGATAPKHQ